MLIPSNLFNMFECSVRLPSLSCKVKKDCPCPMASSPFLKVVRKRKKSSKPSALSDPTDTKEVPLKDMVVVSWHLCPSNPSMQEQLYLWSVSPIR
jgi:hypothetical protein